MARIDELIPKLEKEADSEKRMFAGMEPRQSFIELMDVDGLSSLLDMFDPIEHNEEWDKERQKTAPDIDKIMKERRAIAFMAAGRMGIYKHYNESELSSHVMGIARMNWNKNCLAQTDDFTSMDSVKKA